MIYLERLARKPTIPLDPSTFPGTLPWLAGLDLAFTTPVTCLVGENGSGKSTLLEAIAALSGLPTTGGGRNELAAMPEEDGGSALAPLLRAGFHRRPREGYFFRAEGLARFASLLDQRAADPAFVGDPYGRYGGRSLHARSHGEAFLEVVEAWLRPGLLLMDEPEAALSPQRQLALLHRLLTLTRQGDVQCIIATHSPLILSLPGATLLSFDGDAIAPITLAETTHYQITHGLLTAPERYWKHLLDDADG